MLVLTRRTGETVHISTNITVTVLEVKGNRIRIGIDAPVRVPIVRGELRDPVLEFHGLGQERLEDA